ncbi:MAG: hypothetical protein Q9160_008930 [Pyrenula sp. 1 TL-2023]
MNMNTYNSSASMASTTNITDPVLHFRNSKQQNFSCKEFFDILTERYHKISPNARSTECLEYKNTALNGVRSDIRENIISDGNESSLFALTVADIRCRAIQVEKRLAAGVEHPGHHISQTSPKAQTEPPKYSEAIGKSKNEAARVTDAWSKASGGCKRCKRPVCQGAHGKGLCEYALLPKAQWKQLCEEYRATGSIDTGNLSSGNITGDGRETLAMAPRHMLGQETQHKSNSNQPLQWTPPSVPPRSGAFTTQSRNRYNNPGKQFNNKFGK